jgi:succinyl-diaminopimelate desuccinylase
MRKIGNASFRDRIEAYINKNEAHILADLQKLISFRTVSEEKDEIIKSLFWFLKRAEEMGFRTYKTTTNDVGVVEAGQGNETLGILVHLDVVDPGDPDKWSYPPFEGTIADGLVWGRGTMDDKGAAVICLYGMKALLELGVPFRKKIRLIVGTAEEEDWTDMEHFKEEFPCPDYGFSPDGDFPIYNIENGYADVVLEFDESENIDLFGEFDVHSGKSANTVPSKAVLSINGVRQVFEGVSAHSSTPEMGVNAIEKCAPQ